MFVVLSFTDLSGTVHAQESHWYGGVSIGDGATSARGFKDSTTTSFYAGNRINESVAVEVMYVDLGEFDVKGLSDSYIEIDGFEVSVLGLAKVGESVDIYGKVGLYLWELDAVAFGNRVNEEDGSSLLFGLGVKVPLGETFGARFEWVIYRDIEDEDVDSLNLGFYVNF